MLNYWQRSPYCYPVFTLQRVSLCSCRLHQLCVQSKTILMGNILFITMAVQSKCLQMIKMVTSFRIVWKLLWKNKHCVTLCIRLPLWSCGSKHFPCFNSTDQTTQLYSHIWFHVLRFLEMMSCSAEGEKEILQGSSSRGHEKKNHMKMFHPNLWLSKWLRKEILGGHKPWTHWIYLNFEDSEKWMYLFTLV